MNKKLLAATLLTGMTLAAMTTRASAGEQGVINQAGDYERSMRFYLHPAHGFPTSGEERPGQHPAVIVKRSSARHVQATAVDIYSHPVRVYLLSAAPVDAPIASPAPVQTQVAEVLRP
jgi:hypothetical protein